MKRRVDKYLIKAYKHMLLNELKKYKEWNKSRYKDIIGIYDVHISNGIRFSISKWNNVKMSIQGDHICNFYSFINFTLLFHIIKFRINKINEAKENRILNLENKMKRALPEEYKRSIKLSKIKNKI